MASSGEEVSSECSAEASLRSALMLFALLGCLAFGGMGGSIMSLRIILYCGSDSRRSASSCPMKPAAPVMRM